MGNLVLLKEVSLSTMHCSKFYYLLILLLGMMACGSSQNSLLHVQDDLEAKNRTTISLRDQIRRLPGVTLRNGVPVFTKTTADISGTSPSEPLYVLNGYIVGQSFRQVDELVENVSVIKIEALTGPEAAFYGSRAGNGVILITTRP